MGFLKKATEYIVVTNIVLKNGANTGYTNTFFTNDEAEENQRGSTAEMYRAMKNNEIIMVDCNVLIRGGDISYFIADIVKREVQDDGK